MAVEYEDDEADDMAAATDGGDAVERADELATSPSAGVPAEPTSPKIEQHGDSEAEEGDDVAAALHRRAAQRVEECEAEEAEDVAAAVDRSASVEEGMDELASSPCAGVAVPTSPKIEQHDEAFVDNDAIDGMAAVSHRRAAQRIEECEAEEGEDVAAADDRDASGGDEAQTFVTEAAAARPHQTEEQRPTVGDTTLGDMPSAGAEFADSTDDPDSHIMPGPTLHVPKTLWLEPLAGAEEGGEKEEDEREEKAAQGGQEASDFWSSLSRNPNVIEVVHAPEPAAPAVPTTGSVGVGGVAVTANARSAARTTRTEAPVSAERRQGALADEAVNGSSEVGFEDWMAMMSAVEHHHPCANTNPRAAPSAEPPQVLTP